MAKRMESSVPGSRMSWAMAERPKKRVMIRRLWLNLLLRMKHLEPVYRTAFGRMSIIKFAIASYRIRFLPTKRYSTPIGRAGNFISSDGGTVDNGAFEG